MNKLRFCAGVACALLVGVAPAMAKETTIQAKPGGSRAQRTADLATCSEDAHHREASNTVPVPRPGSTYTPIYVPSNSATGSSAGAGAGLAAALIVLVVVAEV